MLTHFVTLPIRIDPDAISRRAQRFRHYHPKERDCMILAEAEAVQLALLLSFDFDFVDRLSGKCNVRLMTPLDCWNLLGIPRGASPKTVPHPTNPLIDQSWWRW
jgi:hypothetical protein